MSKEPRMEPPARTGSEPPGSAGETVYVWLKDLIATFPQYERVFLTEGDLAARAGVSRTPVREGLMRLETEGLIERIPGKGALVPAITVAEVEAVMAARMLVESWAVDQVVRRRPPHLLPRLESLMAEQRRELENHGPDGSLKFIACDRRFHRAIVRAAGNPILANFYESLRDRQLRMGIYAVTTREGRAEEVLDEHDAIYQALLSGNPEAANAALVRHLDRTHEMMRRIGNEGPIDQDEI